LHTAEVAVPSNHRPFALSICLLATVALQAADSGDGLLPKDAAAAHKIDQHFSALKDAEVSALFAHENTGVKMRAFWEREKRTPSSGAAKMQRLIGNYEACLGMELPTWWRRGLLQSHWDNPKWLQFGGDDEFRLLFIRSVELEENFSPEVIGDVKLTVAGDKLNVAAAGKTLRLAKAEVRSRHHEEGLTTVAFRATKDGGYFLQADPFGTSFRLRRLLNDGRTQWDALGWATGDYPGSGNGFSLCLLSIEPRGDGVLVFGYCAGSHFVEAFSAVDGRPRFRFCSMYTRSK